MLGDLIHKTIDPEGYSQQMKIRSAVLLSVVAIYCLWRCVTEIQYMTIAGTTQATVMERGLVSWMDEGEERSRKLSPPPSSVENGAVKIDYLPGTNLCRISDSPAWWPFIVVLVAGAIIALFLKGIVNEANRPRHARRR